MWPVRATRSNSVDGLSEVAWLRKFNDLWAELPRLHGCRCSPIKPDGLWEVTIKGKPDVTVSGFPLLDALALCLQKYEENPTPGRWASQAEYLAAWAEVGKRRSLVAPTFQVAEKRVAPAPRSIPTFKALPKKGKALLAEKAKQEKSMNSRESWSMF